MTEERLSKNEKLKIAKVLLIISSLASGTYLAMLIISPGSRILGSFLIGFAFVFVIIVLLALYIKYTWDLYKQIRNNNSKPE